MIILLIVMFMMGGLPYQATAKEELAPVMFIVKSSTESVNQTELEIRSSLMKEAIVSAKPIQKVHEVPFSTRMITIDQGYMIQSFSVDEKGSLYDMESKTKYKLENADVGAKINTYFLGLEEQHFGELLPWEEVDAFIPRYTTFHIRDLETGLSFEGQRRAGANHADVQPLTTKDTQIMKGIYGGKWSWKRRAILVEHKGQVIAASMHGMPHGGGALANGFPGHFCIHFAGSVTHKTKSLDLSHQVMIHKAAGLLDPFVKQQPPEHIIHLLATAINHDDVDLARLIYSPQTHITKNELKQIELMRITKEHIRKTDELLRVEIPFTYLLARKGKREEEMTSTFCLQRESPTSEWRIIR
jgi:hypothetical protein